VLAMTTTNAARKTREMLTRASIDQAISQTRITFDSEGPAGQVLDYLEQALNCEQGIPVGHATTTISSVLKPASLVLIAGRAFPSSTESYLLVETDLADFWLALGRQGAIEPIGYAHYLRHPGCDETISGHVVGTFELHQVLPADAQVPCPLAALSGVLWTRQIAFSGHLSTFSSLPLEDQISRFERRLAPVGRPRES